MSVSTSTHVALLTAIFNELRVEIDGEENTHCPRRTHYAM
jgi:hypothetical protein